MHKSFPKSHIAKILSELDHHLVEIRGCKKIKSIFKKAHLAKESDWYEEYLRLYISENSNNIDEAIEHIEKYGANILILLLQRIRYRVIDF